MNYRINIKILKTTVTVLFILISSAYASAQFPPLIEPEITAAASYEKGEAVIRVLYSFPDNFHQTLNKDFIKQKSFILKISATIQSIPKVLLRKVK